MAVQWQTAHADVPAHPGSAATAVAADGSSWAATADAPCDVPRGRPRCTGAAWICVLPAIRVPRTGMGCFIGFLVFLVSLYGLMTSCFQMVPQMMPGMAPPPPGAYIPGPYMQPMPYPMPPNGESVGPHDQSRTLLSNVFQLCTLRRPWVRCLVCRVTNVSTLVA